MNPPSRSSGCRNARLSIQASRGRVHRIASGATPPSSSQIHAGALSGRPAVRNYRLTYRSRLLLLPRSKRGGGQSQRPNRALLRTSTKRVARGSGSGWCGASDSDVPVATREVQHPNNQEEGCPSVGGVGEAHDACGGGDNATGNTRDRKGVDVAVLPWEVSGVACRIAGEMPTIREDLSERCCRRLRSSGASRSCSLEEPQIERREHQDNPDVYRQALPEPMPEEQDVHADHDGYQREHAPWSSAQRR